ncbi:MAG: hypothetical protein LKE28_08590 [Sphaerochaeta sp.]|nr:hypothetical protein [Sphaerochaeta sp.]
MAELHEECGVFGMWLPAQGDVADKAYYALYALQHRGQEGCGIAVNRDGAITTHKGLGLVHDVFDQRSLKGSDKVRWRWPTPATVRRVAGN